MKMSKQKSDFMLMLVVAGWGLSFIFAKNVANEISSSAFIGMRFFVSAIALCLIFPKKVIKITKHTLLYGLILGTVLCFCLFFQVWGLKYTSVSNSAFITSISVVIVPVFSTVFLKKRPTISNIAGICAAVCGLFLITGGINTVLNKGDLLTLGCAILAAVHIILIDVFTNNEDPISLCIWQCIFCGVTASIIYLTTDRSAIVVTSNLITSVLAISIICTVFGYSAQLVVQKYTTPTRTSLIFALEPVFAWVYALVVPDRSGQTESFLWITLIGCILIVSGAVISEINILNKQILYNRR